MTRFADAARVGASHLDGCPFGLVNVAAQKVLGLVLENEIADRRGAGMQAGADAVERRSVRRRVTHQHQRRQAGEALEPAGDARLAVFAGVWNGVGLE